MPGCGKGHDPYFLAKHGALVTGLDISTTALAQAASVYRRSNLVWRGGDILQFPDDLKFDRIWEYTCFCALAPSQRSAYMGKLHHVLKPGGRYWGLVFTEVPSPENGPPFQIEAEAFRALLQTHFQIEAFEPKTSRSIRPRKVRELWFEVSKAS